MLIPEITKDLLNKIQFDQYGRINAVLAIDKPVDLGSHEVVDQVRHILRTRHVGHAGALDPFATGMLLILVGKYTKYTDAFIALDKSYQAEVLLGVSTNTQDPEGAMLAKKDLTLKDLPKLEEIQKLLAQKFQPGYLQFVPLFSSVKVSGQKLRVLARKAKQIKFVAPGQVELEMAGNNNTLETITVNLPAKQVTLTQLEVKELKSQKNFQLANELVEGDFFTLKVDVSCTKGTYIRQLAEDIGLALGVPASLQNLRRTRVGQFEENVLVPVAEIAAQAVSLNIVPKAPRPFDAKLAR